MNMGVFFMKPADEKLGCLKIGNLENLTGNETEALRNEIEGILDTDFATVYIDTKDVKEVDLSGINEIIHSNHRLNQAGKTLVLMYRRSSAMDKWVSITSLDSFISTAILPG